MGLTVLIIISIWIWRECPFFLLSLARRAAGQTASWQLRIICHQSWSCSLSNPAVICIVSAGRGQVSARAISKEKAIPWKHKGKEEGKQVTACLCAGSFSGVADHDILRLFFAKRKLKDKHLKEKLISVSRWQAAISPQGTCQGSTDVSVRTITWFKESGEKGRGRGGRWQIKTKQQKLESSLLGSWFFFKGQLSFTRAKH